jgi:hypothetical protein
MQPARGDYAIGAAGLVAPPGVHVRPQTRRNLVGRVSPRATLTRSMEFSRKQLAIAAGMGGVVLLMFFSTLAWLNNQGPVLSRSDERDPLSGIPSSITLNPLRDRASEQAAAKFIRALRDGQCQNALPQWSRDYRKRYAAYICDSESEHPLVSWVLVDWEDAPPLRILHYRAKRLNHPGQKNTYKELFSVTTELKNGEWVVTKYDAMY